LRNCIHGVRCSLSSSASTGKGMRDQCGDSAIDESWNRRPASGVHP
jgi:hypothetical protein